MLWSTNKRLATNICEIFLKDDGIILVKNLSEQTTSRRAPVGILLPGKMDRQLDFNAKTLDTRRKRMYNDYILLKNAKSRPRSADTKGDEFL